MHHRSSSTRNVKRSRTGKAIFVLGPSSSGKSTLCDALARYLDLDRSRYVREVARTVMREQGFTRKDVDTYAMQQAILTAQLKAEREILERGEDDESVVMLSDRSAVDPIVYASTSKSPGAEDMRRRLMKDKDFQSILPFYRQSLFGECVGSRTALLVPDWSFVSGPPASERMDPRRRGTHSREPMDIQPETLRNTG